MPHKCAYIDNHAPPVHTRTMEWDTISCYRRRFTVPKFRHQLTGACIYADTEIQYCTTCTKHESLYVYVNCRSQAEMQLFQISVQ